MEWLRPVEELERYFNEKDFGFKHRYGGDPLFALDNLIPVAESAARRPLDLLCDAGKIKIEHKWNNEDKPKTKLTGVEALAGIHNADAWVIINTWKRTRPMPKFSMRAPRTSCESPAAG